MGMQCDMILPGPNGRPIVYDLLTQDKPAALLILVHGFKSYKNWGAYDLLAQHFHDNGLSVCKFNFSHNGGTAEDVIDFPDLEAFGKNTYSKEMSDLKVLIDHLLTDPDTSQQLNHSKVFLMGHSRGGSIATLSARENERVTGLITLNAVTDLQSFMSRFDRKEWKANGVLYIQNGRTKQSMPLYYDLMEDFEANQERFDIRSRAQELNKPTLIVQCEDDETVAPSEAHALKQAIPEAELLMLESGGHTLGAKQPWTDSELPIPLRKAAEKVLAFVRSVD